jgi:hypothetical protein
MSFTHRYNSLQLEVTVCRRQLVCKFQHSVFVHPNVEKDQINSTIARSSAPDQDIRVVYGSIEFGVGAAARRGD